MRRSGVEIVVSIAQISSDLDRDSTTTTVLSIPRVGAHRQWTRHTLDRVVADSCHRAANVPNLASYDRQLLISHAQIIAQHDQNTVDTPDQVLRVLMS